LKTTISILLLWLSLPLFASENDSLKTNRIVTYFKGGQLFGQVRNFTMSTINQGELHDYYANATGVSIHYETKPWKGLKAGINGIFVYKTFSNDLLEIDSHTGKSSSYEKQLFDIDNPGNYDDLVRLEQLYLDYQFKKWNTTLGKMEVESPIVNVHDGRMMRKVYSGLKSEYSSAKWHGYGAWIWKASPRSTTHWYTVGESIGLNNNGCLPDGFPASYKNYISSKGLGILGLEAKTDHKLTFSAWNYFLENVSNTVLINPTYRDSNLFIGAMYLYQSGIKNGGNEQLEHTYFHPSLETHAISGRAAYTLKNHTLQLNATHVFKGGNFIFPRELGMDPFYTFISRSQIEGFGDVYATTLAYIWEKKRWNIGAHWNYVHSSTDPRFNKYDIPSYHQFNLDIKFAFSKHLEGLELRYLLVYRKSVEDNLTYLQTFNKVNFIQNNLILNFNF